MRYFRLSVFGRELVKVAYAGPERPEPAVPDVYLNLEMPATQGSGCYFADTAAEVAFTTETPCGQGCGCEVQFVEADADEEDE